LPKFYFLDSKKYDIEFDGELISLYINEESDIDVDTLMEMRKKIDEIRKIGDFPLLVIAETGTNTSNEANEILTNEGKEEGNLIVAVVVKNLASRINAQHFKSISKRNKKVEIFTNEQDARDWISKVRHKKL
jgi:hypothetical protein